MLRNSIQISDLVYVKSDSPAKCSLGALHAKGHGSSSAAPDPVATTRRCYRCDEKRQGRMTRVKITSKEGRLRYQRQTPKKREKIETRPS